ncbi:MAG: hypothetical protein PHC50_06740 [Candidatus Cloacimonetes bacterium]|nr:hypothetical protein [Candidatus Cloacimonadota bacterium]
MKKVTIALLMLLVGANLLLSTSITGIRAQDFDGVACRFVLDLNQNADVTVAQKGNGIQIDIAGFDGKDTTRKVNSKLIQDIKITKTGVLLSTIAGLKYENMRYDDTKQIVIDFFKPVSSRAERLSLAKFYTDRALYDKADQIYGALYDDYPNNEEILENWGTMLELRDGKSKAKKATSPPATTQTQAPDPPAPEAPKRREIPSPEMPKRQEFAGKPQLPPQPGEESRFIELAVEEELDSLYRIDSLVTMKSLPPMRYEKISIPDIITDLASRHFMLTIIIFVCALVIIYILLFGLKKQRRTSGQSAFEAKALQRMVGRLLADGWSHKEIAQELKISLAEVKGIADQPQYEEPETDYSTEQEPETPFEEESPELPESPAEYELAESFSAEDNSFLDAILQEAAAAEDMESSFADTQAFPPLDEELHTPEISEPEPEPEPTFWAEEPSFTPEAEPEPEPVIAPEPEPAPEPEAEPETPALEKPCEDPFRIFIKESDVPAKHKK